MGDAARARSHAKLIPPGTELHADALLVGAIAELRLGHADEAQALLREASERYPERPHARLLNVLTLLEERRFDEARAALDAARDAFADDEKTRAAIRRLEIALYQAELAGGEPERALTSLRSLLDEYPQDLQVWNAFAAAHVRAGQMDLALERIDDAMKANPDRLDLHQLAASLHSARGEVAEAERILAEHAERSGEPGARIQLARLYLEQGENDRALASVGEALASHPEEPSVLLAQVELLLVMERYDEAEQALKRYAEIVSGRNATVRYLRARLLLARGRPEDARRSFEAVLPELDNAVTQYWMGVALEALGDRVGAQRRYRAALRHDAGLREAHLSLLRLAEQRADWGSLARAARAALRARPGERVAWLALSNATREQGHFEEAEAAARQALERFPDSVEPILLLAQILNAQARYGEAQKLLAQAVERFGGPVPIEAEIGIALGQAGRLDAGIARVREVLGVHPDAAVLHAALAKLLFAQGRAAEGARASDRALELDPADPDPLRVRAQFRAASGNFAAAAADARRYLEQRPDDARLHFLLGVSEEQTGRLGEASEAYRRVVELDPANFAARNNLAQVLAAQARLDDALEAAQEAYRLASTDPHVLDTLGDLYLRKGLPERAISFLEDARTGVPDSAGTRMRLATAYRDVGRTDEARQLLAGIVNEREASPELRGEADEALRSLE